MSGLAVARHLCEKLNLNYGWVWSTWDPPHRMELGINEVRSEVVFYGSLAGFCSSMQEKYLTGKHHEQVRQWAHAMNTSLLALGGICTSRFHASERRCVSPWLFTPRPWLFTPPSLAVHTPYNQLHTPLLAIITT